MEPGDNLKTQVCRPVQFPHIEAKASMLRLLLLLGEDDK